jgi:hypothetical protein
MKCWLGDAQYSTHEGSNERKEDTQMKYDKPELFILASAVDAIKGHNKGEPLPPDSIEKRTPNAYEADE